MANYSVLFLLVVIMKCFLEEIRMKIKTRDKNILLFVLYKDNFTKLYEGR